MVWLIWKPVWWGRRLHPKYVCRHCFVTVLSVWCALVTLTVNIAINLVVVKRYGIIGLAGATAVSATLNCLLLYVIGIVPALGLLPIAFFATLIGTLLNSQGAINHSWQLVTLMGLAQLIVYAWPRKGQGLSVLIKPDLERHRQAAWAVLIVIAAGYVICGVVKVWNSDFMWLHRAPWLAVQLYKTHFSHFYDTLEMPPQWLQQITETLVQNPNLARLIFGAGLFIELAAFVIPNLASDLL